MQAKAANFTTKSLVSLFLTAQKQRKMYYSTAPTAMAW